MTASPNKNIWTQIFLMRSSFVQEAKEKCITYKTISWFAYDYIKEYRSEIKLEWFSEEYENDFYNPSMWTFNTPNFTVNGVVKLYKDSDIQDIAEAAQNVSHFEVLLTAIQGI